MLLLLGAVGYQHVAANTTTTTTGASSGTSTTTRPPSTTPPPGTCHTFNTIGGCYNSDGNQSCYWCGDACSFAAVPGKTCQQDTAACPRTSANSPCTLVDNCGSCDVPVANIQRTCFYSPDGSQPTLCKSGWHYTFQIPPGYMVLVVGMPIIAVATIIAIIVFCVFEKKARDAAKANGGMGSEYMDMDEEMEITKQAKKLQEEEKLEKSRIQERKQQAAAVAQDYGYEAPVLPATDAYPQHNNNNGSSGVNSADTNIDGLLDGDDNLMMDHPTPAANPPAAAAAPAAAHGGGDDLLDLLDGDSPSPNADRHRGLDL